MTDDEMKFFLLGKILRRNLMAGVKEATMYSYNGVVLPKLPEWDRETYPYAVISYRRIGTKYTASLFVLSSVNFGAHPDSGNWAVIFPSDTPNGWELVKGEDDGWRATDRSFNGIVPSAITWANFDILNEDGTVYLAASKPVPVYE